MGFPLPPGLTSTCASAGGRRGYRGSVSQDPPARKSLPGRLATAVYPDIDYARWRRRRRKEIGDELRDPDYADLLRRHPERQAPVRDDRPTHVVVVPLDGGRSFGPAQGNFYYEAGQLLRESGIGVSVVTVAPGEPAHSWHARLLDHCIEVGATHLFSHAENDPQSGGQHFTWDRWWTMAAPRWDGVFIGTMFDSSYGWITAGSRQLARISDRYVLVDICMPMDGVLVRGRPEVGPVLQPVSRETLTLLDERLAGLAPQFDVSFIGALYPYRVELIEALRAGGVSVAVNPHRDGGDGSLAASRANQPSWLDFMAGLASSRMTINFSQSSAGPYQQLKWRVTEATLTGTLLLTDDIDRTSRYFAADEYGYFPDLAALPRVIEGFLDDPDLLERTRAAGRARVRSLVHTDLWSSVERVLARRGLRQLGFGAT